MRINDLRSDDEPIIEQAATLLFEGFAEHHAGAWPDLGLMPSRRSSPHHNRYSVLKLATICFGCFIWLKNDFNGDMIAQLKSANFL